MTDGFLRITARKCKMQYADRLGKRSSLRAGLPFLFWQTYAKNHLEGEYLCNTTIGTDLKKVFGRMK